MSLKALLKDIYTKNENEFAAEMPKLFVDIRRFISEGNKAQTANDLVTAVPHYQAAFDFCQTILQSPELVVFDKRTQMLERLVLSYLTLLRQIPVDDKQCKDKDLLGRLNTIKEQSSAEMTSIAKKMAGTPDRYRTVIEAKKIDADDNTKAKAKPLANYQLPVVGCIGGFVIPSAYIIEPPRKPRILSKETEMQPVRGNPAGTSGLLLGRREETKQSNELVPQTAVAVLKKN